MRAFTLESFLRDAASHVVFQFVSGFGFLCSILAAPPTAELEPLTDGRVSQTDEVRHRQERALITLRLVIKNEMSLYDRYDCQDAPAHKPQPTNSAAPPTNAL